MNSWMAGKSYDDPSGAASTFVTPEVDGALAYTLFRKENQVASPSQMWTLIDEDAGTINDSLFIVDIGAVNGIADMPSNRHGNSYELGFADGHMDNIKLAVSLSNWTDDSDWA